MIGLFGGTFDPPHFGHVALAESALVQLGPRELLIHVVADPGHRGTHCPPEIRLRMAEAAFRGLERTRVELDRHRYTVDMLRERRLADPLVLVGADQFASFPTWKEPAEVLRLARVGVATRPGVAGSKLAAVLATLDRPERVVFFEIPPIAASSTEVRNRARRGEAIDDLVPPGVARLIEAERLYRDE